MAYERVGWVAPKPKPLKPKPTPRKILERRLQKLETEAAALREELKNRPPDESRRRRAPPRPPRLHRKTVRETIAEGRAARPQVSEPAEPTVGLSTVEPANATGLVTHGLRGMLLGKRRWLRRHLQIEGRNQLVFISSVVESVHKSVVLTR